MWQKSLKEAKSRVSKRESATTNKTKLALFLQLSWLIHVRELRLFRQSQSLVGVRQVVELERVIGVREVLIRLFFDFSVGFNPVKGCVRSRV